jgi:hypothetical protein
VYFSRYSSLAAGCAAQIKAVPPFLPNLDPTHTLQAGVKDIVLAVNYRPEVMVSVLKKTEEEYGITINFSVETEPLGTGQLRF